MTEKQKENIIHHKTKTNDKYHDIISLKILSEQKTIQKTIQKIEGIDRLKSKHYKFQNISQYQYGNRFYYWKWCRNYAAIFDPGQSHRSVGYINDIMNDIWSLDRSVGYWYVEAKHSNIKSEILCNYISKITQMQWQCLLGKAGKHQQTKMAKSIYCSRRESAKFYGLKYGDVLSSNHIIAMLIYCNYDTLSRKFSETYRKVNEKDNDYDIKQRHGNYYWLGRYLRECVECFGMKINDESCNLNLYHGTNKSFIFPSMIANIKVPFSTTTSYPVAASFCGNKGVLLELSIFGSDLQLEKPNSENMIKLMLCDMRWISDYPQEEEIFSCGGLCCFTFRNIIELPRGINYRKYLIALTQIINTFRPSRQFLYLCNIMPKTDAEFDMMKRSFPSTMQEQQIFFRLISHQLWKSCPKHPHAYEFKSCPTYFDSIMDLQFKNVILCSYHPGSHAVMDKLVSHKGWINFYVLTKLLPNLKVIDHSAGDKAIELLKDASMYESILSFVQCVRETQLRLIFIWINPKYCNILQQYLMQYKKRFVKCGWNIDVTKEIPGKPEKQLRGIGFDFMGKLHGIGLDEYGTETKASIYITRNQKLQIS
eukprot:398121_1